MVQRRASGAAGKPLGDPELDRHYLVATEDEEGMRGLLHAEVRRQLVADHREAWMLSHHDGVFAYVQVGKLVDPPARARALQLLRVLAPSP